MSERTTNRLRRVADLLWRALVLTVMVFSLTFLGDIARAIEGGIFGGLIPDAPAVLTRQLQASIGIPIVVAVWPIRSDRFALGFIAVGYAAWLTLLGRVTNWDSVTLSELLFVIAQFALMCAIYVIFSFRVRSAVAERRALDVVVAVCIGGALAAAITGATFACIVYAVAGIVAITRTGHAMWRAAPRRYVDLMLLAVMTTAVCVLLATP